MIQAERLRAAGRADAALKVLAASGRQDPSPRTRLLLRLARARCLERLDRPGEASDLLERHAPEHRGDALYDYNRHVLALRAAAGAAPSGRWPTSGGASGSTRR
ncbi:MAG: tetratricopeptide repeat protein [Planctomycetota bacterium]